MLDDVVIVEAKKVETVVSPRYRNRWTCQSIAKGFVGGRWLPPMAIPELVGQVVLYKTKYIKTIFDPCYRRDCIVAIVWRATLKIV